MDGDFCDRQRHARTCEAVVECEGVNRYYNASKRRPGLLGSIWDLLRPRDVVVHALRNISFSVHSGERVGLVGPNGAGKTTLLKILSGIIRASDGAVRVLSQNPARRLPSFLRRIAMVSGSRGILSWDLTANDTLELLRRIYSCPRDEYYRHVEDLAEKLSVRDMLTTPVRQLSLGQRRKCELLAVFARRPELVFLDEPTLGLDVGSRHTLWDFIEYLSERGTFTTILTSHYMEDVERLCDRVILLHEGQVIFDNPTAQAGPKLGSGIRVVVDSPTPDAIEAAHPGLCRRENGRLVCDVECMADAAKILQQIMSGDRSRIHAVSVRHESLDEVMRRLGEE